MKRRMMLAYGCAALALAITAGAAHAQPFPSRPIRVVVGFPPGGSNDIVARRLAPTLSRIIGVQVIIDNKPGANATIGTDFVAKSAPDGYTLTLGSASPLAISPYTYANIPYDTLRDFVPVTMVAVNPELIAIHPSVPARDLKALIALAKAQPSRLNFASSGSGGLPHLAIELFKTLAGVNVTHVPYKGAGPALTDVLGGQVHGIIVDIPVLYPHVKDGRLRGIAVTAENRAPLLPHLPTAREQGLANLIAVNWFAVMAPAKTPRPIVDRLFEAIRAAAVTPEVRDPLAGLGVEVSVSKSPDAFAAFLREDLKRWERVARVSGARAD